MLIWMVFTFPFKDKLICSSHIISEFGFLIYTSTLFPFLSEEMETNSRSDLGSIIIWGVLGLIILIWIIFIIHIIKVCILKRQVKKDETLAKELEKEEKAKAERDELNREKVNICGKRHRELLKISHKHVEKEKVYIYIYYLYLS